MGQSDISRREFSRIIVAKYGVVIALGVVIAIFGVITPNFMSVGNFTNILRSISVITVLSLGLTVALAAGAFNLAVTGIAGFAGALSAGLMVWNQLSAVTSSVIALIIGMLMGAAIGLFVIYFKVDDLLASLGAMYIAQGMTLTYTGGLNIYSNMIKPSPGGGFTSAPGKIADGFIFMGQGMVGVIPMPVIIMFIVIVLVHVFLNNTKWGRNIYSVGSNPEAAYLAGIPVNGYKIFAYSLSGILAAFAGILLVARLGSAQIAESQALLLDCVAASYIGFSFLGQGKPNAFGTFIGAALMGIMVNGLSMLGVSYTTQDIFKGSILLLSLAISRLSQK